MQQWQGGWPIAQDLPRQFSGSLVVHLCAEVSRERSAVRCATATLVCSFLMWSDPGFTCCAWKDNMLLTTHTARRCPTVVGHWAIFGLPTLAPFVFLFLWALLDANNTGSKYAQISGTGQGRRSIQALKNKCVHAPIRSKSKGVSLQNATSLAQPVAALADTSG